MVNTTPLTAPNEKKRSAAAANASPSPSASASPAVGTFSSQPHPLKKPRFASGVVGARSAYTLFVKEQRENIISQCPDVPKSDHQRLIANVWNRLPQEQRQKYQEKAALDRIRYQKEVDKLARGAEAVAQSAENSTTVSNGITETTGNRVIMGPEIAQPPVDSSSAALNTNTNFVKPVLPLKPIGIAKSTVTGKYIFPTFSRDDTLNARLVLKYHGSRKFLDMYLPDELNSLYLYFLIRLLGFELKDASLTLSIRNALQDADDATSKSVTFVNIDDPLSKHQTVRLIKDLQRAMNKVLASRMRMFTFSTVNDFVARLQQARNVILLTGAGVSTSLGIPDFRSSEGFYSRVKYLGLSDPQDVFNYELFRKEPSIFYSIANMILPPENIYSPLHGFIKMLADKGKLLRNYTQNIDNLESYAAIPAEKLVHCHGSFASATCVTCQWKIPGYKIFKNIRKVELPICPNCYQERTRLLEKYNPYLNGADSLANNKNLSEEEVEKIANIKSYGVLKPDITFFGEPLPSRFFKCLREDIAKCDLLICIGTSLKVAPVSEIVNMVAANVPQVLINRDPVRHADFDLSLLGYCDDIAAMVTRQCGWEIGHKDWAKLASASYAVTEKERGMYSVVRQP